MTVVGETWAVKLLFEDRSELKKPAQSTSNVFHIVVMCNLGAKRRVVTQER